MKKTVKIILHHRVNQQVHTNRVFSFWKSLNQLFATLLNVVVGASYYVGVFILSIPKWPKLIIRLFTYAKPITFSRPSFKKALGFALLVIFAMTPILLLRVASEGQKIGGRVLGISDSVINDVNSAQDALKRQDFSTAQNNFASVLNNLNSVQSQLDQSSIFLKSITKFAPASYNTSNALEAAQLLTESAQIGSGILVQVDQFRFSPGGLAMADGKDPKQALININNDVKNIDAKLTRANQLLAPLDSSSLPANYQAPLKDSQSVVAELSNQMHSLQAASDLLTNLLLGNKRFLVLLQNNNELRATGGFIGTIAQGQLSDSAIKNLDIRSVYDLDGQMMNWITPPYPMRAVNNRWFLRDANWLASFPDSAQRLSVMYEIEGGETPDLVLAITPDFFIDLLNKTGPITLPRYNVTVSSTNFIEQIQTTTSVAYDKNLNQPKQLLADLYPILLQKIGQDKAGILGLLELVQKNLTARNLLIYSRDPALQQKLTDFRWTGELSSTDKDYLQINSSNLGGTKTDRALERSAKIQTTLQSDGTIIDQVSYTVTNPLPNSSGLLNRSFLRFYVPQGSKVLAADGFSELAMPELIKNQKYTSDTMIDNWNRNLQYDQSHKIYTGQESDKTVIGSWLEVAGGQTKTVTITYMPNFKIQSLDNYSLLWQKQSGMMPFSVSQQITHEEKSILWDNLGSQSREVDKSNDQVVGWKLKNFNQDQFIGLVLSNRTK